MNNKTKFLALLAVPTLIVGQTSCSSNPGISQDLLNDLRLGFKAQGVLKIDSKIYEDENHLKESTVVKGRNDSVEMVLTYTNKENYTGIDYKLSEIHSDGTKQYMLSDNMYNRDGYLYFNSVGYDNVLSSDFVALDKDGNKIPYSSSVSLNPFTLLKANDFIANGDELSLNQVKSSLIFGDILYASDEIPSNVTAKSLTFTLKDDVLTSIQGESYPYYKVETHALKNYFVVYNYSFAFDISEIGTADAKAEIKQEQHKAENDDLGKALKNFSTLKSYRVNRHYKTPLDPAEETIDLYFDGEQKSIYMAVYDRQFVQRPDKPSQSDALFYDDKLDKDELLNAYMPVPSKDDPNKLVFKTAPTLADVNNVLAYEDFILHGFEYISQDVFNKNDDGSYSPIPENLRFMAGDCFVPFLCNTNEIAGGYVDSFKLYLTQDKANIDRIELESKMGSIIGHITITYDMLDSCVIPFDAINNIEK